MSANSFTGQFDGGISSIKAPNSVSTDWGLQSFGLQNSWPAPFLWLFHHSKYSFSSRFVSTPFHNFYHCWWDSYDPGTSSILGPSLLPRLNLQQCLLRTSLQRLWPCHMLPSLCFCTWSLQSQSFHTAQPVPPGRLLHTTNFYLPVWVETLSPLANSCCFLTLRKHYSKDFSSVMLVSW